MEFLDFSSYAYGGGRGISRASAIQMTNSKLIIGVGSGNASSIISTIASINSSPVRPFNSEQMSSKHE